MRRLPREGINAIKVCRRRNRAQQLGRIDHETTANIGVIEGGWRSTSCQPVVAPREARSHSEEKLERQTRHMLQSLQEAANLQVLGTGRKALSGNRRGEDRAVTTTACTFLTTR